MWVRTSLAKDQWWNFLKITAVFMKPLRSSLCPIIHCMSLFFFPFRTFINPYTKPVSKATSQAHNKGRSHTHTRRRLSPHAQLFSRPAQMRLCTWSIVYMPVRQMWEAFFQFFQSLHSRHVSLAFPGLETHIKYKNLDRVGRIDEWFIIINDFWRRMHDIKGKKGLECFSILTPCLFLF